MIQPEGHPGDRDRHGAGDVDGDDEERELATEEELHSETGVGPWTGRVGQLSVLTDFF